MADIGTRSIDHTHRTLGRANNYVHINSGVYLTMQTPLILTYHRQ